MKDSFLSIGEIKNIAAPLLVLHGEHDQTIAIALGRRLFDMAPEPKRFVAFPLGSHTNLDQFGVVSIVHQFLVGANAGPAQ
jgi:fermentation-respiration switch protein FrsA (DUF1100 family)